MTLTLSPQGVTELLLEWQQGDSGALDKLTPLVYDELRRIAHRYVQRERDGHTLETTRWSTRLICVSSGGSKSSGRIERTSSP